MFKKKLHIKLFYIAPLIVFFTAKQQAQIVINNAGIININGGSTAAASAYLVINSPAATPIKTIGTTGGIMMETEYSITQYNIGAATTAITLPYFSVTSGSVQFPLGVTGLGGGIVSSNGNIQFSSKKAPVLSTGYDNLLYLPSGVNNMNGYNPPPTFVADNSPNAIDRFWIIDAKGYSTSPGATFSFGYANTEGAVNGGNSATLIPNLEAMAFDQGALTWGNYGPTGANATGATTGAVSGVILNAGYMGNIFRSWTLVNKLNPLPIELLTFTGTCLNKGINLTWITASESNSNYFTIEKSFDGQNFTWLANVNAAGNSTRQINYSYYDDNTSVTTYYKLSETDKNGSEKTYRTIVVNGCNATANENINVYSSNQNINIGVYSLSNQPVHVTVYDITGRIIYANTLSAVEGNNTYTLNPQVAKGIYMVEVQTNLTSVAKRVPLVDN
jgi:hypothetical protein